MQMSGLRLFRPYAVEGRSMVAVTHLALLGVKIQDAAFRGNTKDKKQSFDTAAFVFYVLDRQHTSGVTAKPKAELLHKMA